MKRLEGKNAIITGAASGIGRASAVLFAREGAKLVVTDVNEAGLSETAQLVDKAGGVVEALTGDASDTDHVQRLVDRCAERFGAPGIFFANAGISGMPQSLLDEDLQTWEQTLKVNLLGPFLALKIAAPAMIDAGGGSVILTASVAGLRSGAGPSSYSASKAGVINLAKTAASQLATRGVRVNAICPGLIETGMTKPLLDMARDAGKGDRIGKHNPMQRAGEPEEIAPLAVYLASDESSYVTGQAIAVDGGITATYPFTPGKVI